MRRSSGSLEALLLSLRRDRPVQALLALCVLYAALVLLYELPFLSSPTPAAPGGGGGFVGGVRLRLDAEEEEERSAPLRPAKWPYVLSAAVSPELRAHPFVSGLDFREEGEANLSAGSGGGGPFSGLHRAARDAWEAGGRLFEELLANAAPSGASPAAGAAGANESPGAEEESCPYSIVMSGAEFREGTQQGAMVLPCGLTLGSHVTLVAKPQPAHPERDPKITMLRGEGDQAIMVSQFMMELQGLKTVDGEDPPRILHFNPRLKGDWSGRPVIELNTCYRMQWGLAQRCDGWRSRADEETVDGLVKCEKWIRDDDNRSEESKTIWWLNRLIGRTKKVSIEWPYPFTEDKLFVLTLTAGLEGYHVNVDGRHVTSFPYRTGFVLEDATGLWLNGDLDIQSIFAVALPTSHPSFAPQKHLEMLTEWQTPPLPDGPIELFIGILSAGNHFAERMAVRKSWMSVVRKSQSVVARFFVALHGRKEINIELKREAEFFRDIVIVPFMDSYDLVVLKTVAICEYGVHAVSARYIMKCDDDTFVRIESVMGEIKKIPNDRSLYVGNMNFYHKPLREGKWAVTYEEWPEEDYPPYANGPGYVISSDIAHFIVSDFEKHRLRLFKMEDVSMGMWVEQFNKSRAVEYVHNLKFCQFGCIDDYYTAHYQSPRQMICMWDKLQAGKPQCCNTMVMAMEELLPIHPKIETNSSCDFLMPLVEASAAIITRVPEGIISLGTI